MTSLVYIVSASRTPMGGFQGDLSTVKSTELGSVAIKSVIEKSAVKETDVDEVLMGNVLSAGVGQAPARQASLGAGLPLSVPCTTVSKVCGSGMKSIMLAFDQIKAGSIESAIAGGMESMSLAPYFLPKARDGQRLGHGEVLDHMFYDGLQNAYDGQLMGCFADANSKEDGISREAMDEYAIESLKRARKAVKEGYFKDEIAPVLVKSRRGDTVVENDEQPEKGNPEKIPTLRPAFAKDGSVTAANASSISAIEPEKFTHAPIGAINAVLEKSEWDLGDVDLFEINEAFAMVTMASMSALNLSHNKVNINGGATALGHPIGASGARIVVTLLHALKRIGKKKGIASLCIGGGEGTALAVELL